MANNDDNVNVSSSSSSHRGRQDDNQHLQQLAANPIPNDFLVSENEMNVSSSDRRNNDQGGPSGLGRHFIRGARRLNRDRFNLLLYDDPNVNQNRGVAVEMLGEGLPSSPDGFSSDSIMEEGNDMSDGMSSVSDLEGRIHPPPDFIDSTGYVPGIDDPLMTRRSSKRSRVGKRTRTGSNSSNSSFEESTARCITRRGNSFSHGQQFALIEQLQKLRHNKEFTDIVLLVEEQEIPCHKVILAACSPYFRAMLSSSIRDTKEGKITIQGRKAETIDIIVRHAYAESVAITASNAQDVLEAADYFQMDTLKKYCEDFLIRQVSEINCLGLEQFASLHLLSRLHRKAKKFAMRNFAKVAKKEEFLDLSFPVVTKYLADDHLVAIREEHVYEAALRWLEHDESRKERAGEVLRSVRLFFVGSRFLFEVVSKNPMFQNDPESQKVIAEACKFHALGGSEWRQSKLPHTRPRNSSGISEVLVVVGGICNNRRLLYAECYNASKNEWTALRDITTPHASMHSYSVCAHKNDVYITGGHSNSGTTVDAVSVYFSNINQWSLLASMHYPRERHGSASVDGNVYVAGGLMASTKNRKKPGVLNSVERYRPTSNRWERVKSLPKRCYSPGVLSYKEKLYVIGGVSMTEDTTNSSKVILDCVQCFDPLTDSWSQLPLGRALARLSCATYNDHFYMISNNASSVFRYNPVTNVLEDWKELSQVNVEFAGLAAYNDKLVISGGQKGNTTLNNMYMIDFATGEVQEEAKMRRSRCMHGCVPIDKIPERREKILKQAQECNKLG